MHVSEPGPSYREAWARCLAVPGGRRTLWHFIVRSQAFAHQQVAVPTRVIVDRRHHLEAVPFVERRCLEGECHQHDLRAAASSRLLLGGLEQLCTEAAVTLRLVHPELTQLTGATPRVPADPRDDAIALAHEEREQFAIGDVGRARVKFVDPIFQVLHSSVATRQAVPMTYRKHANQIGGTVVTPILLTGQLAPQIKTRIARKIGRASW